MKDRRPVYDPDERIFTLSDVKTLFRCNKKKIVKASCLAALLTFGLFLITGAPQYQISATFKEAPSKSEETGGLEKLFGGSVGGESQTLELILSHQVLKPLVERMGTQIVVANSGSLSRVYRRIRDNLLAEQRRPLSDIDWFVFRDASYSGERTISYTLRFEDSEHFSICLGKQKIASGKIGSPVSLPEAQFTIARVPRKIRLGLHYPISIHPWISAVQEIRPKFRIAAVKGQKSIFQLQFFHRDRHFGTEALNVLMEEYRKYLKRDHDQLVIDQLSYLEQKQGEICDKMSIVFDEYTEYLQSHLSQSGKLNLHQEIEEIAKEDGLLSNKIFLIDLELERLSRMETDQKAFIPMDGSSYSRAAQEILEAISNLKQQRDLIEVSLPSSSRVFNELEYENRKEELKEIRDRISATQRILERIDMGASQSSDLLFDLEASLGAWAARLTDSQEIEREDLAGYIQNYVRLLSMQEKIVQEQVYHGSSIPAEFKGIDLAMARSLFAQYNNKQEKCRDDMGHFSRLSQEIAESDFEISSLSAVLSDSLSQRLIERASDIACKLKDERHHSEKEGGRWTEELALQKKILRDHLDQLFKVEQLKSGMLQDKIASLQKISLGCISGQISVLQGRLADCANERKNALLTEKKILEEKIGQIRGGFSNLPDKWRKEKWLELRTEMGVKMVQGLTELVESKTISSHLHHIESKPLDYATLPFLPCYPRLKLKTFLGAILAGFALFSRKFLRSALRGFPTSSEKLRAMRYPVLGEVSSFLDGSPTGPLGGTDLEALRQIFLFLDTPPKGKIVGILEGKGPDYSYALGEHYVRMSFRPLIVRCDFNVKFNLSDLPGLLQVLKNEMKDLPIRTKHGYDVLPSGGYTSYGAELIRSHRFHELLETFKNNYDFVFLVFRSPLNFVENLAPLSLCDRAVVTVTGEPSEQLTPFIDWAYHEGMCRLAFLTAGSP